MSLESRKKKVQRAEAIREGLNRLYPDARCSLNFQTPFQLLVSTVLSAQCTDERVNLVTPALFDEAPDAAGLEKLPLRRLEELIRSTGFFRNKARNLKAAADSLLRDHGGEVPSQMEDLVKLGGVGRKTANVILGNAFQLPGFPVDTHVGRLSRRLDLSRESDPVKVEKDLCGLFDPGNWVLLGHQLIQHGREICSSRRPDCENCSLAGLCPKRL